MNVNKSHLIITLLFILISILPNTANSTETSIISTDPPQLQLNTTSTFTININVYNVTDLSAWQIKMTFNPYIIQCTNISIPEQNVFTGHDTTGLSFIINNQQGCLIAFNGIWEPKGVNGSGTLCQLTFKTISAGISSLAFTEVMQLSGTYLTDSKDNLIPMEANDGNVKIAPEGFKEYQFDVQTEIKTYKIAVLTNSSLTNFNFNNTLKKIEFSLNGTDGTTGSCSISIPKELLNGTFAILLNNEATIFTSSNDKSSNYFCLTYHHSSVYVQILITIFGDLNGDRTVDGRDLAITARAFGSYPDSSRWNPIADVNKDFKVDGKDLALVAKRFGRTWNP